jgi:hypothetical protein
MGTAKLANSIVALEEAIWSSGSLSRREACIEQKETCPVLDNEGRVRSKGVQNERGARRGKRKTLPRSSAMQRSPEVL